MKMIDHEQKKRQERISSLQTSIKNKQDALQKRLTRAKRQAEIAELAQNQSKDVKENLAKWFNKGSEPENNNE